VCIKSGFGRFSFAFLFWGFGYDGPRKKQKVAPMRRIVVLSAALLLAACGAKVQAPEVNPTDMPKGPGLFSGESGNLLQAFKGARDGQNGGGNIGVNIHLWRASLESVGFMPLLTTDNAGGVITTDWYSDPAAPNERVKANILILGKSLRPEALKVALFRQVKDAKGAWTEAPVSPATVRALEDTILTKARALRVSTLKK
jgi:hypothetical protein